MRKSSWIGWVMGLLAAGLAALVTLPRFIRMTDDPATYAPSNAKFNLHLISLALERYAADNGGVYPPTLQPLRDEDYMPKLPDNPYRIPHQPMPEVPLGQHAPGGVTYLPHFATQASPPAHVDSYALLVYSDERASRAMARNHESQRYPLPNGAEAQVPWDYVLMVLLSDPATTRQ